MDVYIKWFSSKDQPTIINVEPDATVADLKEEIAAQYDYDKSKIKLIFASKILTDDALVISLDNSESKPIVYYAPKKNLPGSKIIDDSKSTANNNNNIQSNVTLIQQINQPNQTSSQMTSQNTSTAEKVKTQNRINSNPSNPNNCDLYSDDMTKLMSSQELLKNLMEMGYTEEECLNAIELSGGHYQIAAEILLSGKDDTIQVIKQAALQMAEHLQEAQNNIREGKPIMMLVKGTNKGVNVHISPEEFNQYMRSKGHVNFDVNAQPNQMNAPGFIFPNQNTNFQHPLSFQNSGNLFPPQNLTMNQNHAFAGANLVVNPGMNQNYEFSGNNSTINTDIDNIKNGIIHSPQFTHSILAVVAKNPRLIEKVNENQPISISLNGEPTMIYIQPTALDKYIRTGSVPNVQSYTTVTENDEINISQKASEFYNKLPEEDKVKVMTLYREGNQIEMIMQCFNACQGDLAQTRELLQSM
ncbi:hypothetical protein TRFO_42073 [Tritrichomonas foetus]|uniref:UBA domain-containing protein n=1 Tax=Tritrichomonas foetus TaxID=1144522 RepID=A0A1J4KXU1_9EUKA|nr:hypothetical protein TRFO_42073 [Tritrichomonas foetus]|eukprot:OHT16073.1 hypothetical protein TRFO_42073 [Tritrichomonas foetus]